MGKHRGALIRLARYIRIVEVRGSNPLSSTIAIRYEPGIVIFGMVFMVEIENRDG